MLNRLKFSVKKYLRERRQKGVSILVVAFSLPIFMAGGVAAVDLGAYFSHASRLQNAADAAALAGAAAFVKNKEKATANGHPLADEAAGEYVGINLHDDSDKAYTVYTKTAPEYAVAEKLAPEDDKTNAYIYYRVHLTDTSPSFFAKFFNISDPGVEVSAVVKMKASKHEPVNTITDLFIFKTGMDIPNTIENPDNFTNTLFANYQRGSFDGHSVTAADGLYHNVLSRNPIVSTFDGHMSYTSDFADKIADLSASAQAPKVPFYTSLGKEALENGDVCIEDIYQHTTTDIPDYYGNVLSEEEIKQYKTVYNSEGKNTSSQGYWTRPELTDYSMEDDFVAMVDKKASSYPVEYESEETAAYVKYAKNLSVQDNNDVFNEANGVIKVGANPLNGDGNMALNLDKELCDDSSDLIDSPLFLYYDQSVYNLNINVSVDTKRPLIICAPGVTGQVHFNIANGAEFRGIVCAPAAQFHKMGEGKITGTIMADSLKLDGYGNYTYQNFSLGGSGKGSTEEVDIDFDSEISLVSTPSDVTSWIVT